MKWILTEGYRLINSEYIEEICIDQNGVIYAYPPNTINGIQLCECEDREQAKDVMYELFTQMTDPTRTYIDVSEVKKLAMTLSASFIDVFEVR